MMTKRRNVLLASLAISVAMGPRALAAAPARIVSLKPSITDVVVALGQGERLVGVTRYCELPPNLPRPEVVGDYTRPSVERIVGLAPDVVLGSEENSSRRSIEQLRRMGVRVELFPFTTVGQTAGSIRRIGEAVGEAQAGERLARAMEDELSALKKKWETSSPLRAVIVWGTRPLIVAGPGSYMDELLSLAGITNAVRTSSVRYPRIGLEELIALDPDAIVDLSMGSETEQVSSGRPWDGITALKAVRNGRLFRFDPSRFRAGPGLPRALEELVRRLRAP